VPLKIKDRVLPVIMGLAGGFCSLLVYLAHKIITPPKRPDYKQDKITEVAADNITLLSTPDTIRPGIYELSFPGGMAKVGEVIEMYDNVVRRKLLEVPFGKPVKGGADFGGVYGGDPKTRLGLDYEDIELEIGVGSIPAWVITSNVIDGVCRDAWAILIHGLGQERSYCLQYVPMLTSLGINCLICSYRNDRDAPKSPDGKYRLGLLEYQEAEAALDYVSARGAGQIFLYGFSMGGAIVMQTIRQSAAAGLLSAVILDGPVLDWQRVLDNQAKSRHLPKFVGRMTMKILEAAKSIDFNALNVIDNELDLPCPVLILHGRDDRLVPFSSSELFQAKYPNVRLCDFEEGGHMSLMNSNKDKYQAEVTNFLTSLSAAKTD